MWTTKRLGTLVFAGLISVGCIENSSEEPTAQFRAQLLSGNGGVYNGGVYNGTTFNGGVYNGGVYNGGVYNGTIWNGAVFNGGVYNGTTFNGGVYNGGVYNGGVYNGTKIDSIALSVEGSLLKGIIQLGHGRTQNISGADFIGSVFTINRVISPTKKEKYTIRFDDVYLDNTSVAKDIWRYRMSFRSDSDQTWRSMCFDEAGQPADMVPLMGMAWDFATGDRIDSPSAFTIACKDGALEKCVHLGYRPWATQQSCTGTGRNKRCTTVSLKEYHQACVRMLRADYCGDGKSYTVDGTLLDIYDYLQPPVQLREENWDIEARWTNNGASCLSTPRHPELWPGGCPDPNNPNRLNKLPRCSPYESACGMLVSTFDAPDRR